MKLTCCPTREPRLCSGQLDKHVSAIDVWTALETLQVIGRHLDRQIYPEVKRGGIVVPSETAAPLPLGLENRREQFAGSRRFEAGPAAPRRPGSESGKARPRRRSGPAGEAASILGRDVRTDYQRELAALPTLYPGLRIWAQPQGAWFLSEAALLPGLRSGATFLTGMSFAQAALRSWGFWDGSSLATMWIGPRHTNHPDGSVCAFEPTDATWCFGDPLVELLDLYSLWAVRHLHLRVFGRWPGLQSVLHPFERVWELRADERCGCGESQRMYGDCCRDRDLRFNRIAGAVRFNLTFGLRKPPDAVWRFMREQVEPPPLSEYVALALPNPLLC